MTSVEGNDNNSVERERERETRGNRIEFHDNYLNQSSSDTFKTNPETKRLILMMSSCADENYGLERYH